jgi:hypothetical protein
LNTSEVWFVKYFANDAAVDFMVSFNNFSTTGEK